MTPRRASGALGVLVALAWCGTALGVPTGVVLTSPGNDATPTFAWAANPFVTFDWQLSGAGGFRAGATVAPAAEAAPALPDGFYSFIVRDVDPIFGPGPFSAPVGVTIDTVPPTIVVSRPVAGSRVESGTPLTASYTCAGAISCAGPVASGSPVGTLLPGPRVFTVQASDAAGNVAAASVNWTVVDTRPPTAAAPQSPAAGAVLGVGRPTFTWSAAADTGGLARYEVFLNGTRRATVAAGQRLRWVPPQDLASGAYAWFVRAVDRSGNVADSATVAFSIDTGAPAPPTITQPPRDPGANRSPVVVWTGTGPTFTWSLFRSGVAAPIVGPASGPQASAALGPLTDGAYAFRLNQTNAFGRRSADVEISFRVDSVGPGAPVVTSRPAASSATASPAFAWTPAEPGGTFAWQVLAADGRTLQAAQAVSPAATTAPLAAGKYSFVVSQIDEAGNTGAPSAAESFAITPSASAARRRGLPRPATLTPRRLRPAPGARLKGRRAMLRWRPGPKGTTIYNLQIFRMTPSGKVAKVLSVFPRRTSFVLKRGRLAGGRRYIWRVWPYLNGTQVAAKPVGVSFFNIPPRAKRARR